MGEHNGDNGDNGVGDIFLGIGVIISTLSLVVNISYFIVAAFKKRKEEYTNTRFLSTQFLVSSITCCFYINWYNYFLFYTKEDTKDTEDTATDLQNENHTPPSPICYIIVILRTFSITPTICSCACVAVSTFLVINKRHLLKQNSRLFRFVFILLGWGPSLIIVIIILCRLGVNEDVNPNVCVIKNSYISYPIFGIQMFYLVVLYIVCGVVMHGICKLNSQGDIEIKKAIKQLIRKVAGYMVGIAFFSVFAIFTHLNQLSDNKTKGLLPYFQFVFSIMDPVMAHLFVINHKFLIDWKNFYTCKKEIAETDDDIQGTSQSLKLKASVNQQEDDDDEDDDE